MKTIFYSGTSGLVIPFPKYKFPKEHESSSRLTYYGTLYNSIEINSSFYKLPLAKTTTKWAREVPSNFKFTFKVWREITHVKHLNFNEGDLSNFFDAVNGVGDKRGCLLFQFPPSIKIAAIDHLRRLLDHAKENDPTHAWTWALEFRDPSWYTKEVFKLADGYDATIVRHDKRGSATPFITTSNESVYMRFHGPDAGYRGTYTEEFLIEYAGYIKDWLKKNKTVFVYFNNTLGHVLENLNTLNKHVLS